MKKVILSTVLFAIMSTQAHATSRVIEHTFDCLVVSLNRCSQDLNVNSIAIADALKNGTITPEEAAKLLIRATEIAKKVKASE